MWVNDQERQSKLTKVPELGLGRPVPRIGDERTSPAWSSLIRYCAEMRHGEIEKLKIQDGQPVIAEITRLKVKFTS